MPSEPERGLPTLEIFLNEEPPQKRLKISFCLALYAILALIWAPGFSISGPVYEDGDDRTPPPRVRLKPPPEAPIERVVTRELQARKVPVPDATPDLPEPVVAPNPPDEIDLVATDDWMIGVPEHQPEPPRSVYLETTPGVESVVFTRRVLPDYPARAMKLGMEGYVILSAILRTDGTIDEVKVIRGLGRGRFGFEDEAIAALKQWQYLPAKLNDRQVDVRMNLRIDFQLNR